MMKNFKLSTREELERFRKAIPDEIPLDAATITEIMSMLFDRLIFEEEKEFGPPPLSRLVAIHDEYLSREPLTRQAFEKAFDVLTNDISSVLKAHDLYEGNGFEYIPVFDVSRPSRYSIQLSTFLH